MCKHEMVLYPRHREHTRSTSLYRLDSQRWLWFRDHAPSHLQPGEPDGGDAESRHGERPQRPQKLELPASAIGEFSRNPAEQQRW